MIQINQESKPVLVFSKKTITTSSLRSKNKLLLKERKNEPVVIKDEILRSYNGSIIFKVVSDNRSYKYYYSLDEPNIFNFLAETGSDKILSKGYTGAYCGLYSTTNGKDIDEHADFDWAILK